MTILFLTICTAVMAALWFLPLVVRLFAGVVRALVPVSIIFAIILFLAVAGVYLLEPVRDRVAPVWHRIEAIFEKGFTA